MPYDKTKIGKRIARGTDRTVYMYCNEHVIKFSWLSLLVGKGLSRKMQRDYALIRRYLGDYILETNDVSGSDDRCYVEIQPYIKNGKPFCMEHARIRSLKIQLEDIAARLNAMTQDGYHPLDLLGHKGMWKLCLSNLFVDEHGKLKMIDATLLEAKSVGFLGWIIHPLSIFPRMRQRYILSRFLSIR